MPTADLPIRKINARAFVIPTDRPESDGTLSWNKTTLIVVNITAGNIEGIGYTYADAVIAPLINNTLRDVIMASDAANIGSVTEALWVSVRNLGRRGIAACAISALDLALWDIKAKSLGANLAVLLGCRRQQIEIYGSGGFTSYDDTMLTQQLSGWVNKDGCAAVKMKIGSDPSHDPRRIRLAREAAGEVDLFVDANGAYTAREAIQMMPLLSECGVSWFEEPVSSDDLAGLAFIRKHASPSLDIAAGEYSYVLDDVRLMLQAEAVDVQQSDVTRCGGITGFLQAASLCQAFHVPLSGHCAPSAHLNVACAVPGLRHLEWFHDHVRIEQMLFDGAPHAESGKIQPDFSRPGHGFNFKEKDAEKYAI
jgi:L-alanine-DL-glutamate epimerase-like enolase superfamily enzyme